MYTSPIQQALESAFSKYPHAVIPVLSAPNRQQGADLQCNTVLALAGRLGVPGKRLAEEIAGALQLDDVADVSVTGPGFINFTFHDKHIAACAAEMAADAALGVAPVAYPKRIVSDSGGPNVAKALHVGHLRSFVIGESLRRILSAVGHEVIADIHYGDWGLPIGKMLVGIEESGLYSGLLSGSTDIPAFSLEEMGALYRSGNGLCSEIRHLDRARLFVRDLQAGDPVLLGLWKAMRAASLQAIRSHIDALGAHFDTFDGESDVEPLIGPMLADLEKAGIAVVSDGALVGPISEDGSTPPVLLRKADGASLYSTTDLATIVDRIARHHADVIVYCVDGRQKAHLDGVFKLAAKASSAGVAGFGPLPVLVHVDFGTVNGVDGKPFSTRDGGPALLGDLISMAAAKAAERLAVDVSAETAEIVGMGALKFADLSSDRRTGYVFDDEQMMSFNGRTGPYVQYAAVRIASLLSKAEALGHGPVPGGGALHPLERAVLLECLRMPTSVTLAAESFQPKEVADRAFLVAQAVAKLYAELDILKAPPEIVPGRLAVLALAGRTIGFCLGLLGISVPDRM